MSISKRLIAIGYKGPHPLAGWKGRDEWAALAATTPTTADQWIAPDGRPIHTEAGDQVGPSAIPGWARITREGRACYVPATFWPATQAQPVPPTPAAPARQLTLF
ncbi:MAG: hypothetical protein M3Q75_13490 [Gemmatimonadota bacterium]|nr:hypothetical protein [Gemmatimonadota bacterium]